jgi:chromosome segregation protein
MRLTRLELSGFKSFADTVDLAFDDGVTAVVGPNGCGKSNISDAVRWVLGEQRARLLRSTRMDEIIFQGSVKRHPVNISEVSLIFDNSDGVLPVSYHEVAITRRLSRSGQSEYFLNQAPVRLRDIMDVLRGTGLGSDAGVVIEAQMIDRLLSDKTEERRSLFEEAAGIGHYRDRKDATERRLERTGTDLQRLDDIISEVQTQVRSLARQRGKTERHDRYSTDRFGVVMTLARQDLADFDANHTTLRERIEALRTTIPETRQVLETRERAQTKRSQERSAVEIRRTELERQLAEARIAIERLEGDLNLADERLQHAVERRASAIEERAQAEVHAGQATSDLEAALAERNSAAAARESVQTELDLRSATETEAREQFGLQRAAVRELSEQLQRRAETLRALAGEQTALHQDLEELRRQESDLRSRLAATAQELRTAESERASAETTLAERERQVHEAATELERARHQLAAAREHEAAVRIERREVADRSEQLAARLDALAELERTREGMDPAVRALMESSDQFGGAVLGPLSDFLTIEASEARLAERLLGEWLQAVLVQNDAAVEAIRRWHAVQSPGPLVLLPVDPGPSRDRLADTTTPVGLDVDPRAEAWVHALLGGTRPGDADGNVIRRANGAVFLPGTPVSGPLSRRAELEQLRLDLERTQRRLDELKAAAAAAEQAHVEGERAVDAAVEQNSRARAALRDAEGADDDAGRRLQRAERERDEADAAIERVAHRIEERDTRLQSVAGELATGDDERARLTEQLATQQAAQEDLESAQDAARERRVHWQVEEVQVSAREQAAIERETRARASLDAANAAIARLDTELEEIGRTSEELTGQRSEWSDKLAEQRVAVQEMEAATRAANAAVETAESQLTEAARTVDEARTTLGRESEELHRFELELTEAQGRRQAMIERIETEWHKPIAVLLEEAPTIDGDPDQLRAEAERLAAELERIGPVNPLAVEEHAEETKRLEFLQSQRDDLVAARDSLRQALREIETTARQMFLETFAVVKQNFLTVFQTLFDGGECDVRLMNESDPLESEIQISAAPRGKRTQRIHLLSTGERALVAISLLFAIYLTKPAPFCLLDEVDAPLDDANVMRFVRLLEEFKSDTQFIVITHNPRTMQVADAVYGVTMQEPGVSTIVGVRLGEVGSSVA